MKWTLTTALASLVLFCIAANAAELKPETTRDWQDYLVRANARILNRMQHNFLWVDESEQELQRVRAGNIVIDPIQPRMPIPIHHGLVHHWVGAEFISGVHIEDVVATVREYDQYPKFYRPTVIQAQVIEAGADPAQPSDHFVLTFVNKGFFSKHALECESTSSFTRLDAQRSYVQSHTVRVQEWAEYASPKQHKLPEGKGTGYLWNVFNTTRFEERDGGVYVEMEAIALSRDVPVEMREFVNPIIRRVSKATLVTSLDQTRQAVESRAREAEVAEKVSQ
jgi:hypothetical protein